jgi:hypothetical protein
LRIIYRLHTYIHEDEFVSTLAHEFRHFLASNHQTKHGKAWSEVQAAKYSRCISNQVRKGEMIVAVTQLREKR